jgi:hypothetical protein
MNQTMNFIKKQLEWMKGFTNLVESNNKLKSELKQQS